MINTSKIKNTKLFQAHIIPKQNGYLQIENNNKKFKYLHKHKLIGCSIQLRM